MREMLLMRWLDFTIKFVIRERLYGKIFLRENNVKKYFSKFQYFYSENYTFEH